MVDPGGGAPEPDEERGRRRRGLRALAYGLIALLVLDSVADWVATRPQEQLTDTPR